MNSPERSFDRRALAPVHLLECVETEMRPQNAIARISPHVRRRRNWGSPPDHLPKTPPSRILRDCRRGAGIIPRSRRCSLNVADVPTQTTTERRASASSSAERVPRSIALCPPRFGTGPPPRSQMTTSSPTRRGRHSALVGRNQTCRARSDIGAAVAITPAD